MTKQKDITGKETVIEQLRKIKTLAERGVAGEADAAKSKLEQLLKKYDLTLGDLAVIHRTRRTFTWRNKHEKKILVYCVGTVLNASTVNYSYKGSYLYFELTDVEFVDASELYAWYLRAFRVEMENMVKAFIIKHNLGCDPDPDSEYEPIDPEEWLKLKALMNGMTEPSMPKKPAGYIEA